jgi:hypothetical protein
MIPRVIHSDGLHILAVDRGRIPGPVRRLAERWQPVEAPTPFLLDDAAYVGPASAFRDASLLARPRTGAGLGRCCALSLGPVSPSKPRTHTAPPGRPMKPPARRWK